MREHRYERDTLHFRIILNHLEHIELETSSKRTYQTPGTDPIKPAYSGTCISRLIYVI